MRYTAAVIHALVLLVLAESRKISLKHLKYKQAKNFIPVYTVAEEIPETFAEQGRNNADLILMKPKKKIQELRNMESMPADSVGDGRTFGKFLLLSGLMNFGSNGGGNNGGYGGGHDGYGGGGYGGGGHGSHGGYGGGGDGFFYPIILNNTPLNLTNINTNNNTLTNIPTAPDDDDGAAAAAAANPGMRISYFGIPQTQTFPMQNLQMPTEVYHQRQAGNIQPAYTIGMMNMPNNGNFVPFPMSAYIQNDGGRRKAGNGWQNTYSTNYRNPFIKFANSFRG